jgi:hypothetical protein
MPFANDIQRWFDQGLGGALILPDGWYGRPQDNQHARTSVVERDGMLTMVLDGKLMLRFEGLKSVSIQKRELVIGPYDLFLLDWEMFGASTGGG